MEIEYNREGGRSGFIVRDENGKRVAEMTYTAAGTTGIIIDHTQVDEAIRGQKIGDKLLFEAVKYARANSLKIFATCSFALAELKKTPEYSDVFGG